MTNNHNKSSLNNIRALKIRKLIIQKRLEKLDIEMKINRASNDNSQLALSEKMRNQVDGLLKAIRNSQDAISFIKTTEKYLNESTSIVQRIKELAIQASNGINTDEDKMRFKSKLASLATRSIK